LRNIFLPPQVWQNPLIAMTRRILGAKAPSGASGRDYYFECVVGSTGVFWILLQDHQKATGEAWFAIRGQLYSTLVNSSRAMMDFQTLLEHSQHWDKCLEIEKMMMM